MRDILKKLIEGEISIDEAENQIKISHVQELGENVKFDSSRENRIGIPEAVYALGKTDDDLLNIINNIDSVNNLMITKLNEDRFNDIKQYINKDVLKNSNYSKIASI